MDQSLNMVKIAYDALDDKLAEDIKIIDIRSISVLADYFIIADGNNKNQVQAMVDNVQEELFKAGYEMKQMEGYREGNWILLDFGDIIIHIFDKENRLFYLLNHTEEIVIVAMFAVMVAVIFVQVIMRKKSQLWECSESISQLTSFYFIER